MLMVCLLLSVEFEGEHGFADLVEELRTAAGAAEDRPAFEDRETAFDQGAHGVDNVVVLAFRLGQAAALERDDHAVARAGIGLVRIESQAGLPDLPEEVVSSGGGEVMCGAGIAGAEPDQVPVVVGQAGELDRVVTVLVAPVPVDVFALVGAAQVVDTVDLGAGPASKRPTGRREGRGRARRAG